MFNGYIFEFSRYYLFITKKTSSKQGVAGFIRPNPFSSPVPLLFKLYLLLQGFNVSSEWKIILLLQDLKHSWQMLQKEFYESIKLIFLLRFTVKRTTKLKLHIFLKWNKGAQNFVYFLNLKITLNWLRSPRNYILLKRKFNIFRLVPKLDYCVEKVLFLEHFWVFHLTVGLWMSTRVFNFKSLTY